MSTIVKTTEEFSTRRKLRYGSSENKIPYTLNSSALAANISPHKCYYDKDQEGASIYLIEFKIGEFNFDEISIRTEGHRLIVQGKSKQGKDPDELSREFTRDFTLPSNVDQYSIRAQLDEATRQLSLIGVVKTPESRRMSNTNNSYNLTSEITSATTTTAAVDDSLLSAVAKAKLGSIKETKTSQFVEYEIFLGSELKDGQINIDISGNSQLNIRALKSDWDKHGDFIHELKRQIRLPYGANTNDIEHHVNERSGCLIIKCPLK